MKHEIEIPDLPEGWEAVAYRCAYGNEHIFNRGMVEQISSSISSSISKTSTERLIVRKKQARRIVLEETEEDTYNSHNHTIYVKGITIDIYSNKLWKIVEDGKCAE